MSSIDFSNFSGSSGDGYTSDWGLSLKSSIGKEWWVSENWGLGLAAQTTFASIAGHPFLIDDNPGIHSYSTSRWYAAAFALLSPRLTIEVGCPPSFAGARGSPPALLLTDW